MRPPARWTIVSTNAAAPGSWSSRKTLRVAPVRARRRGLEHREPQRLGLRRPVEGALRAFEVRGGLAVGDHDHLAARASGCGRSRRRASRNACCMFVPHTRLPARGDEVAGLQAPRVVAEPDDVEAVLREAAPSIRDCSASATRFAGHPVAAQRHREAHVEQQDGRPRARAARPRPARSRPGPAARRLRDASRRGSPRCGSCGRCRCGTGRRTATGASRRSARRRRRATARHGAPSCAVQRAAVDLRQGLLAEAADAAWGELELAAPPLRRAGLLQQPARSRAGRAGRAAASSPTRRDAALPRRCPPAARLGSPGPAPGPGPRTRCRRSIQSTVAESDPVSAAGVRRAAHRLRPSPAREAQLQRCAQLLGLERPGPCRRASARPASASCARWSGVRPASSRDIAAMRRAMSSSSSSSVAASPGMRSR